MVGVAMCYEDIFHGRWGIAQRFHGRQNLCLALLVGRIHHHHFGAILDKKHIDWPKAKLVNIGENLLEFHRGKIETGDRNREGVGE